MKQAVQKQQSIETPNTCSFKVPFKGKWNISIMKSNLNEAYSSQYQSPEQWGVQGGALASLQVDVTEMCDLSVQ